MSKNFSAEIKIDKIGPSTDYFVFGAGCVEVEVDCMTGDIEVVDANLVMDVGRSINPAIDVGQVNTDFLHTLARS
jgi:xanthine dehydrogenase/oxidase